MGTFCQHKIADYYIVTDTSTTIVNHLYDLYKPQIDNITEFDVVFIANVFNGLLVDYDAITNDLTLKVLELFEGIGEVEMYFIPKQTADRKMVYSSLARFGSYLLMQFKHLYGKTDFQHSQVLHGVERDNKVAQDLQTLQSYYKRYRTLLVKFIDKSSLRLNPTEKKIIFTSLMFEFSLESGYPAEFINKDVDIRSNDVYWTIPSTLFNNYQAQASNVQEIKFKLAKWIGSPVMYDTYDSNYLETNMTEVAVLNTAGTKIVMNNLTDSVRTRAPWSKVNVYDQDILKCKLWDSSISNFSSSSCSSFESTTATLSCSTCDANSYTTTTVYQCNFTTLDLEASHYDDTESDVAEEDLKILYPIYYALDYWQDSFGFVLTITAAITYLLALIFVLFCDQFPRRRMLIKIYEKIRKREIEEGYDDEESCSDASDSSSDEDSDGSGSTHYSMTNKDEGQPLKKRSKLKDYNSQKEKKYKQVNMTTHNASVYDGHDAIDLDGIGKEENKKFDTEDDMDEISRSKFKEKQATSEFLAPHKPDDEDVRKSTRGSKNSDEIIKKNSKSSKEKKSSESSDESGTSKSEDNFEKYRKLEDKLAEKTHYYLMNIFVQGSTLHGFLWIDSYINPRHVRGTIFFTYVVLIWYVCAVVYNNTREPEDVPDFEREASDLTWGEIWLAYAAPWGATILLYIFTIIMKLSPERIRATRTTRFLDYVIAEYGREQILRYLMGYLIIGGVHFMIFVYIIQFTAIHGWRISWRWWYTGSLSFFINIFIYDPLIAVCHWLIYR